MEKIIFQGKSEFQELLVFEVSILCEHVPFDLFFITLLLFDFNATFRNPFFSHLYSVGVTISGHVYHHTDACWKFFSVFLMNKIKHWWDVVNCAVIQAWQGCNSGWVYPADRERWICLPRDAHSPCTLFRSKSKEGFLFFIHYCFLYQL